MVAKLRLAKLKNANSNSSIAQTRLTPQRAAQLLDSQKGEESALVFRPPEKPKDESKLLKDWQAISAKPFPVPDC